MGYYTHYKIVRVADGKRPKFTEWLQDNMDIRTDCLNGDQSMRWYDHERDIAAAMRQTGSWRVFLHGDGESQGDVWDKEFTMSADGTVTVNLYRWKMVRETEPEQSVVAP